MKSELLVEARDLVMLEGWLLDRREWTRWVNLYSPKATYWLPIWLDEDRYTTDPQSEMSLIYYDNRTGLEDRVFRIGTEQSLASTPLPRTCHLTSVVQAVEQGDGSIQVDSNWMVHSYRLEKTHTFYGSQTHVVEAGENGLQFRSRTVIVANDVIPNVLDIYSV